MKKIIKKFNDLPIIDVSWAQLYLDPNNPRLHRDNLEPIDLNGADALQKIEQSQDYLHTEMRDFDVNDLTFPMKEKGFIHVGIPMMLVKLIEDNKYLVLEGNRRLTSIRSLMNLHNEGAPKDMLPEEVISSFNTMKVVDCSELTEEQVEEYLGMIHVGGTKPWDLMPKAKYLFSQFIRHLCLENGLSDSPERYDHNWISKNLHDLLDTRGAKILKKVAVLNTCAPKEVKKSVAIFRMFIQVNNYLNEINAEPMKPKNASLIGDTYDKPNLRMLFGVDEKNLIFSDTGLDKWTDACCDTPVNEGSVITAAAAGDSNLRQLNYIVEHDQTDGKTYLAKVFTHRTPAGDVEAELKSVLTQYHLEDTLKIIFEQFNKINLKELSDEFSDEAKHLFKDIKKKFNQITGATEV